MLWKCYTQYASKFGKLSSGHRTGKVKFSFQSQRKAMPKNAQTTAQLHSSHMLLKYEPWTSRCSSWIYKSRGTRYQIANSHWIIKNAREFQKNIYFCFIDYAKAFDYMDHNKLWKIFQEMGIPVHLTCLLRNVYAGQEATVRTGHGTKDGSKLGKEYLKALYCYPAYLTYMQSTSCKKVDWMKHKLESRLPREISVTSDMQMKPPLWQKAKKNKRTSWWKWKREWKSWLKTQHSEN